MAKIDVMQTIEKTRGAINPYYDLNMNDIKLIVDNSPNIYYLATNFFNFGYAQGMKAAKAEIKKQGRTTKGA